MEEGKIIQFATMQLEGVACDRWHHELVSQDHAMTHSYEEFFKRLITQCDRKDKKVHYKELAQLKQVGHLESYINGLQKNNLVVPNMP